MSVLSKTPEQIENIIRDLKTNLIFADLSAENLVWLAERMEEVQVPAGIVYARMGDPLDHLIVVLEGEMHIERPGDLGSPFFIISAGQVTGLLPFSRSIEYKGTARTALPLRTLRLHKDYFPEMMQRMPMLAQRLVGIMSDRIREFTRQETQRDKLMALGKLSAGLAHELNNPAAAAQRAAKSLRDTMFVVRDASLRLLAHPLTFEQRQAVVSFEEELMERVAADTPVHADPVELSDREAELTACLEAHNVKDAWKIAGPLAEANADPVKMEALQATIGENVIGDALQRVSSLITLFGLIHEIDNSTKRIADLVGAIKRYSYMDQAAMQEVDLREDLENTLKIFGHWLKKGITVKREFANDVPRVCAYGSELNQVWTNLIDNAIDAMNGNGELLVRTCRELDSVVVDIGDNGPGVPANIQSRIFEPFFTTKTVGEGTGLGLDTAVRIVHKHHGRIDLKSQPGNTRFTVRLPIKQPKVTSQQASNGEQPKREQA
jgi:signal transduction histidine kinase